MPMTNTSPLLKAQTWQRDIKRTREGFATCGATLKHINCMLDKLEQAGHAAHWNSRIGKGWVGFRNCTGSKILCIGMGANESIPESSGIAQPYVPPSYGARLEAIPIWSKIERLRNRGDGPGFARMDRTVDFDNFNEGIHSKSK